MKQTKQLRELSREQLEQRAEEFKKELLKLNAQVASGANAENPGRLRVLKKGLARIHTLLNEQGAQH